MGVFEFGHAGKGSMKKVVVSEYYLILILASDGIGDPHVHSSFVKVK